MKIKITLITAVFISMTFISCSNEKESTQMLSDVATILNTISEISENSEKENSDEINSKMESSTDPKSYKNEDIDKLLNEYEMYVTEFSKLSELAESGDPLKILEYSSKLDKLEEINEIIKITKSENNLNPDQISKLLEIQSQLREIIQ